MSLANTLSVLLNFKTDLSGLDRFSSGLRTRLEQVQEFNRKVTNGTAAINSALQAAAGYFAVGSIKGYIAEAIEARSAQAKLAQALTQTKQNTAAYRAELGDQASALQKITGLEDELLAGVQRQLVFGGAQRKDIAELTRLTVDFASAKEIDAVSAAKAVARALQGEGDELKRYGIEVDLSKNKTAALIDGLGKFSGQAGQAFSSLPEGMRELQLASKEARQSAGEAVLAIAGPFLNGLARGLAQIKKQLDAIADSGSAVGMTFRTISGTLGSLVGDNLGKLALLLASLLALKGGGYLVNETIKLLSASFLLLTKQSLPAMLAGLQSLSKEVGLLQALGAGGASGYAAFGLTAAAAAAIGYTIGKAIGDGINSWQRSFATRAAAGDSKVLDVMQTVNTADTPEKLKAAQEAARKLFDETKANLDAEKARWFSNTQAVEIYRQQLLTLGQTIEDASNPALARSNADAQMKARYAASVKSSAAWLHSPEADKDREDIEAGIESRRTLDERLANARAWLAISERSLALAQKARADGHSDANIEKLAVQARAEKERTLAKISDLEKESRARQNNDLSRQISEGDIKIAQIENTATLTDLQKNGQILPLLEEQNKLISARIALREKELGLAPDDQTRSDLQKEIDSLRQQLADKQGRATGIRGPETKIIAAEKGQADLTDPSKHYQTLDEGARGGLLEYLAEVGTMVDQIANSIKTTLNTAVSSVSSNLTAWVMCTQNWKTALQNIRQTVMQQLLQSIIQMGVQWLVNEVIIKGSMIAIDALGDLLRVKRVAKENAAEGSMLPMKTANAAATGISSFGVALIFGALAIALIMGAMGGFASGGYTDPGEKNKAVGIVHAGEWVAPKWMVDDPQFGEYIAGLESARRGRQGLLGSGIFGSGWSSLGQFLGAGALPKWAAPGQSSFQKKWNLLDGTSLYGEQKPGGENRTLTSEELATAIAARNSEGSASSGYTATLPNQSTGPSSAAGAAGAEGSKVDVKVYAYVDRAQLLADLRRDPAMRKYVVDLYNNGG